MTATQYDAGEPLDHEGWLRIDEAARAELVLRYHRKKKVRLPNLQLHATMHVVVENQVAMREEIPVHRTLERLMAEGLDRHDAVHAIGSVLARHLFAAMKHGLQAEDPNVAYWAELEKLSASNWSRNR
jgi:hypothetical protein